MNSANKTRLTNVFLVVLAIVVLYVFPSLSQTGLITSDGDYKSPASDGNYKSPQSDGSYKSAQSDKSFASPKAGPGYVAPKADNNYTSPTSGPGYEAPNAGDGFVMPATFNVTLDEANGSRQAVIPGNITGSQGKNEKKEDIGLKKDDGGKENDQISKWPFVGKWRAVTNFISYEDGDWKYNPAPDALLGIRDEYEWEFGSMKGTWAVYPIEEADWERWKVKPYEVKAKLVLDGWNGGQADGPIEGKAIWVIYNEGAKDEKGKRNIQMKFQQALSDWDYSLIVKKTGAGLVKTVGGKELYCGSACVKKFRANSLVELIAIPDEGWAFSGWSGACSDGDAICRVVMDGEKTLTAEFKGACQDDSGCPDDQKCANSNCVQVDCECGAVNGHECNKYECCSNSDCGESSACNKEIRKCILKPACRPVVINGDSANKHDLVFVGAGFNNYDALEKAIRLLMDYDGTSQSKLGVFSLAPFKENKNKFNSWVVIAPDYLHREEPSPIGGDLLQVPVDSDYERFVKTCERDTVIVLSPGIFRPWARFPTSGASGGVVYMSLNNPLKGPEYFGRTIAHELGHAIGGLADEYVEYNGADRTEMFDFPNCAPNIEDAKRKWGDLVGVRGVDYYTGIPDVPGTKYYKHPTPTFPELGLFPDGSDWGDGGCGYVRKNIRPAISTIMGDHYTFNNNFGPVNERALSGKLEVYS